MKSPNKFEWFFSPLSKGRFKPPIPSCPVSSETLHSRNSTSFVNILTRMCMPPTHHRTKIDVSLAHHCATRPKARGESRWRVTTTRSMLGGLRIATPRSALPNSCQTLRSTLHVEEGAHQVAQTLQANVLERRLLIRPNAVRWIPKEVSNEGHLESSSVRPVAKCRKLSCVLVHG